MSPLGPRRLGVASHLLDIPIAFLAEIGWWRHQVFTERRGLGGDVGLEVVTNQLAMQLGAAFLLR